MVSAFERIWTCDLSNDQKLSIGSTATLWFLISNRLRASWRLEYCLALGARDLFLFLIHHFKSGSSLVSTALAVSLHY
jgi:hypothetical protein